MDNSLNVNLLLQISPDGFMDSVTHELGAITDTKLSRTVTIGPQSCPHCFYGLTLNISLHQPHDKLHILEQVTPDNPLECFIKGEIEIEPEVYVKQEPPLEYDLIRTPTQPNFVMNDEEQNEKLQEFPLLKEPVIIEKSDVVKVSKSVDVSKGFECDKCNQKFSFKYQYDAHMTNYYKGEMACRLCKERITRKTDFVEHLKNHGYATFPCPFCETLKEFDTEPKLNIHMAHTHWEKRFNCGLCREYFATQEEKTTHLKTCAKRKFHENASCSFCHKQFDSRRKVSRHESKVHRHERRENEARANMEFESLFEGGLTSKEKKNPDGFQCDNCKVKFLFRYQYEAHMTNYYKGEMACRLCKERITRKTDFIEHLKNHGYSTFPCPFCENLKEFDSEPQLNIHLVNAHWGKRYNCGFCKKFFTSPDERKFHYKTCKMNDFQDTVKCSYCTKPFNSKKKLVSCNFYTIKKLFLTI